MVRGESLDGAGGPVDGLLERDLARPVAVEIGRGHRQSGLAQRGTDELADGQGGVGRGRRDGAELGEGVPQRPERDVSQVDRLVEHPLQVDEGPGLGQQVAGDRVERLGGYRRARVGHDVGGQVGEHRLPEPGEPGPEPGDDVGRAPARGSRDRGQLAGPRSLPAVGLVGQDDGHAVDRVVARGPELAADRDARGRRFEDGGLDELRAAGLPAEVPGERCQRSLRPGGGPHDEGVGEVRQQAVAVDDVPHPVRVEGRDAGVLVVRRRDPGEQGDRVDGAVGAGGGVGQHEAGQLVVGEGVEPLLLGESGRRQTPPQLLASEGHHRVRAVPVLDPVHPLAGVVLRETGQVLQAELVLDRQDQLAARLQEPRDVLDHDVDGVPVGLEAEHPGVLQHPDDHDGAEALGLPEPLDGVRDHLDVGKVTAAIGADGGAARGTLDRNHLEPALAQRPGDGPHARADLQDRPREVAQEGCDDVAALIGEVVERGPVPDPGAKIGGQGGDVVGLAHGAGHVVLGLVPVVVAELALRPRTVPAAAVVEVAEGGEVDHR